jgi:hypothetical protein
MKILTRTGLLLSSLLTLGIANADTVDDLLAVYAAEGAGPFGAAAGEVLWQRQHPAADGGSRACTSCHNNDLRQPGRQAVTGRTIDPLAPSVSPKRLTERRQIEKWLKRNCDWTLGRACTPQEKGDLLSFIRTQ